MLTAVALFAGCGSAESSSGTGGAGGTTASGGGGSTTTEAPARVRFFVDERPQDTQDEEVESAEARWGDPIRIVVEGLESGAQVKVDVSTGAWGVFAADAAGSVDLGRDAPLSGTWPGADVDGPFWSAPVAAKPIFDVGVKVTDATSGAAIAEGMVHRRPVNVGVESMDVSEGTKVGTLSRPPMDGTKRPGFLAFGGSEGGTSTGQFLAYYLAQLGYVAFGVGYFGAPGLPANLEQVPLELLEEDLAYLKSQPDVDPERIAVIGGSRGGELALLLGATFPDLVRGVVAEVPSGYVWGATTGAPVSAWTFGGVDLPAVPSSGAFAKTMVKDGKTYYLLTPAFLADIAAATPEELAAARIPVENTNGSIFLAGGADDQLWPSCVLAQVAMDGLVASDHTASHVDEIHCYPDAGHFISFPPGSSTLASQSYYSPAAGVNFWVGGTPEGIAHAQRQGNTDMRAFLDKVFGQAP